MASSADSINMALYCDFENVALGVRDANYDKFDISRVLERLLLKGNIVVKKAYCDWDRYKSFKASMHEANFELIEIPHLRQSGKNSADIRLVVDALDLCYTKSHVDTFVIISGDSDFSPLVSKLRENAKQVIGVGVKQSTSDLLIANCDEFIFYDDLVRDSQRAAKRDTRDAQSAPKRSPEEDKRRKEELESRRGKGIEIAVETFDALMSERGDSGKIWASMLKEAIKRRRPDFSEGAFGFRAFGNLLEEAQARGLLVVGRDEKSGAYVHRPAVTASESELNSNSDAGDSHNGTVLTPDAAGRPEPADGAQVSNGRKSTRGRGTGGRKARLEEKDVAPAEVAEVAPAPAIAAQPAAAPAATAAVSETAAVETAAVETAAVETAAGAEPAVVGDEPAPRRAPAAAKGRGRSSARGRKDASAESGNGEAGGGKEEKGEAVISAQVSAAPAAADAPAAAPRNPRTRRPAATPPAVVEQAPAAIEQGPAVVEQAPVVVEQDAGGGAAASAAVAKKPAARRRTRKPAETAGEGE
ncbi:hypothetical protein M622_09700 [Thauera terpenica 58Eu]|uniref:HTH OST-type domain-containing protein n=1 Tax=Thauera terpenica 58Eu TaxID=1348657 RepID=S9ZQT3_9RHOO|nr:NYN domain-containing protein [Thauera terpenica]EPZ16996.1 hypothetical protein M622_09700 [Thauera terpenica 58Eu]